MIVMLILLIIPVVSPLGIPITVSDYTQEAYNIIDALPPDSTVILIPSVDVALWPEEESFARAVIWHLSSRPLKWAMIHFGADAVLLSKTALDFVDIPNNFPDKEYGKDYVFMNYIVGGETGVTALLTDVHSQYRTDYFGTPIDELEIMQYLKDHNDIDLVVYITGSDAPMPVRVFHTTFDIPLIMAPTIGWFPTFIPYYNAGQMQGLVGGVRGGAEYELLVNRPGMGLAITDALSIAFLYTIALLILGNIHELSTRLGKNEEVMES